MRFDDTSVKKFTVRLAINETFDIRFSFDENTGYPLFTASAKTPIMKDRYEKYETIDIAGVRGLPVALL